MIFIDTILKNPRKRLLKNVKTGQIEEYEIQDDPDNIEQQGTKLNSETFEQYKNEIILEVKNAMRPVGSLFFTDSDENPADTFGFGTWERIKGKVIVGVDEEDEDFKTVNTEIGNKTQELRALIGACNSNSANIGYKACSAISGQGYTYSINGTRVDIGNINHTTGVLQSNGNNPTTIQPSHLSYIWKRIA